MRHQRCFSSVKGLHRAYCEWDLSCADIPCDHETFKRLLQEQGFLIVGTIGSGLILRRNLDGVRIYPNVNRLLCGDDIQRTPTLFFRYRAGGRP